MKQDDRVRFDQALLRARMSAYPPGEFVEQESFMRAREIREIAVHAGIGAEVSVLDVCCGVGGPGRFIARELNCTYLGVDSCASAIEIARPRARGLPCRFERATVPPLPRGAFDVVLLLEAMLAFPEKERLLHGICSALRPGGRFAFTMEAGLPLTQSERERMPDDDPVWLMPPDTMLACLEQAGLAVRWRADWSQSHRAVADAMVAGFVADASDIAARIGHRALDELLVAHRLWSDWLADGRVRKFAVVAQKT